ncbi:MAG: DUF308 domain-containing protein [Bacilli bacterium]|nr:DUF308 domain-containing protein [Bacilli bacterium]
MYGEDSKRKRVKKTTEKKEKKGLLSRIFRKRTRRLLTNIDRLFTKIMWIEVCISLALILLGSIFLLHPEFSVKVLGVFFGIGILSFGGLNIYAYIKRRELNFFRFHLIYGIAAIILGLVIIFHPFETTQAMTIFLGLWVIYLSVIKIDLALRLKVLSESSWLFLLVSAVLGIFMSIIIFINPFTNLLITQVAGSFLILEGILNATDAVMAKNRSIDVLEDL